VFGGSSGLLKGVLGYLWVLEGLCGVCKVHQSTLGCCGVFRVHQSTLGCCRVFGGFLGLI